MWKRTSRKRFIVFLSIYSLCIVYFSLFLWNQLTDKPANCTVQSIDFFKKENNLISRVDSYFKNIFSDFVIVKNISVSHEWFQIASNIYLYSVHLDTCPSHLPLPSKVCIKFIGATLSNDHLKSPILPNVKCAFKNNFQKSKEESVAVEILPENHEKKFSAAFLFCPVRHFYPSHATLFENHSSNLTWVVLENVNLQSNSSQLIINNADIQFHKLNIPQGISLCVRPLFKDFVTLRFIEFLTYYSVTGVNHFIFYYHKSFKSLKTLLKVLKFSNISSEVFSWNIPLNNDLIHEYGQIVFIQDCLARSKNKFTHSLIVDLDEFIVPQYHEDIRSLVLHLDKTNPNAGSYVIPMALFCYEYPVDNTSFLPFHILSFHKRQKTPWAYKFRSKYIVKPERIRYSGIHFTWAFENNFKEVFISPDVALVNHYRYCCGMLQTWFFHLFEFSVLSDKIITDNTLLKHKDVLMNNSLFKSVVDVLS